MMCGNHVVGRVQNIKEQNILCDNNKVENELHFLLNCKYYVNERSTFLRSIDTKGFNYSQADGFRLLCNLYPRQLSKYI